MEWNQLLDPSKRGQEAVSLAHAITQAYGYILENNLGLVADEAELLFSRDAIKLSLLVMHAITKEPEARSLFHHSYAWLGFFQPLTSEEKYSLSSFSGEPIPEGLRTPGPETFELMRKFYADSQFALPVIDRSWKDYDQLSEEFRTVTVRK